MHSTPETCDWETKQKYMSAGDSIEQTILEQAFDSPSASFLLKRSLGQAQASYPNGQLGLVSYVVQL